MYMEIIYIDVYKIDPYMIDEVFKRSDKKMGSFTKEDLKDGMIVEYRTGKVRRLVIRNLLLGEDEWASLVRYGQNLRHVCRNDLDIMKVYKSNDRAHSIVELLKDTDNLELIWAREEPKEIPTSEAMKILREKFGCEVKLVEDR